jgi:peptidoglycan/xylan/chitin deacetylase (PgdA/CDA1 family)
MGIFLIGYDVESGTSGDHMIGQREISNEQLTNSFMESIADIHEKNQTPGTLFVIGKKVEEDFKSFRPYLSHKWLEFQQHTYNHFALKPVVVTKNGKINIQDFPTYKTAREIEKDIRKTNSIFKSQLGVQCIGLSTPFAYFMGLADRPDILEVLKNEGIKYIRSFHLNKEVFELRDPLPFDYDPFFYDSQGFPDILEFCVKGYSDVTWALRYGWESAEGFVSYVKQSLHMLERTDSVWGLVVHDWSLYEIDNKFRAIDEIITYAKKVDIEILSFSDAYTKLAESEIAKATEKRKVDWKVNFIREI